jgi:hypothetical protein
MTMTNDVTDVAPPQQSAARRFTESLHVLVDPQTREFLIGSAVLAAELVGATGRPKEGAAIRELLDDAISRVYRRDKAAYEAAVTRGREELAARARA